MLKNVRFGEISAEVELEINPDFITRGYYDYNDATNCILNEHQFVVLGNKGSGKSMVGEHLNVTSGIQENGNFRFVTMETLNQFPYKSFKKIISGTTEIESKLPTTWKWVLLIYAYKTFNNDMGKNCENDSEFNAAVDILQKIGVLPADLHKIAVLASKKSFKLKLPIFEATEEHLDLGGELHFLHIVDYLEKLILKIKSDNKHYLIIDGLDEALSTSESQYESIATLISEARDINSKMRINGTPFKIIILCRKDLYKRLPGANKNKITSAYCVELNWYQDQVKTDNKEIVKLAIFRSQIYGERDNVFNKYFPQELDGKLPAEYLLENTRYTPRDFLQLLTFIGKNVQNTVATYKEINAGIKDYSSKYFWPEIEDELHGYISKDDTAKVKKLLMHYHKKAFYLKELIAFAANIEEYKNLDLHKIMIVLYECGAISNQFYYDGLMRYQSRTKDDNDFNDQMSLVLHRGMWKALNL